HRWLNRHSDRQPTALWTVATNRIRQHVETRAYTARRTREGRSRGEIVRCPMGRLARHLSLLLLADRAQARCQEHLSARSPALLDRAAETRRRLRAPAVGRVMTAAAIARNRRDDSR